MNHHPTTKPFQRFWNLVVTGELQLVAGALSFSTLLSLIPFLAVSMATIQFVSGFETLYPKVESFVLQYFQGPTGEEGIRIVQRVFKRVYTGRLGSFGALALIFASVLLMNDMERGIHRIWNLPQRRPLYHRIFFYWIFLILFPATLAILVGLTSLKGFSSLTAIIPFGFLQTAVLFLILFFIYKVVPHTKVSKASAAIGATCGTLGLIILGKSFKWFSQTFFSWGKLYGSLAAIPALLIWILLVWYVILVGVAVTASFRNDTDH